MKLGTYSIKEIERRAKTPTAISLFSGAGGAALGLCDAGYEVRVMVEWDKAACRTLKANFVDRPTNWREQRKKDRIADEKLRKKLGDSFFDARDRREKYWIQERPPTIMNVDITKTPTADILKAGDLEVGEATILEGGFPCQGFSLANNNRAIDDPRNQLYKECVRVIKEALPRSFMLENVPGLVSMANGEVMLQIMQDLAACGYDLTWDILNAADYGVPQNRRRVIFVGMRVDVMTFDAMGKRNPGLHMGAAVGQISVPKWYLDKYVRKSEKVKSFAALPHDAFYHESGGKTHMRYGREFATLIQ